MTRFVVLLSLAAAVWGQKVEYSALRRELIEKRLSLAEFGNGERRIALEKLFRDAGCDGERLTTQAVKRSKEPNVICTLPGETDQVILVGAHFDHVDRGEGAADNWSGASLLPSLYQSLRTVPRRHTFVFAGFTDEEKGLVGSEFHARHLTAGETEKMRAMVNIDTLGLSPTKVWASRADKQLFEILLVMAASLKLPVEGVNIEKVGSTDSESFARRKIPAISIHSVTQETLRILHSPLDRLDAIQMDSYYDSYRLIAAYLALLDERLKK